MKKRIPVIVVSGFLGSGKTTFLRYLLKESNKKFGLIINEFGDVGIDGDFKRIAQKYSNFENLDLKKIMKKNPITVNKDTLAASALSLMNTKKITSLCVHNGRKFKKTIGLVHMHDILKSNIS